MAVDPKIIVALDLDVVTRKDHAHQQLQQLQKIVNDLDPKLCRIKIGKTLFTRYGPPWVESLQAKGFEIFLDLKFHDIPHQIEGAIQAAAMLGVWMVNVHALGGMSMLKAAKNAVKAFEKPPLLIGVTILTSLQQSDLVQIGLQGTMEEAVLRLASLCFEAGLDGVVCSAQEAKILKQQFGPQFLCVTPGIRLPTHETQDQQRIMTPQAALAHGSDYLVIGRPITNAPSPKESLQQIYQSMMT